MDKFLVYTPDAAFEFNGSYVIRGGILIVSNAGDDPEAGPQIFSQSGWQRIEHIEAIDFDYVARKVE